MAVKRRSLWQAHRRIGLAISLFALVVALSGFALLFRGQLREPLPTVTSTGATISLDVVVARASEHGGGAPATDVTMPSAPGEPYQVWLDDEDETLVFVDDRGDVRGARPTTGGLTRFLFRLHTGELFGDVGWVLAGLTGLSLVALSLSGVVMASFRWRRRR